MICNYITKQVGKVATVINELGNTPCYTHSTTHNEQFVGRVPANSSEFATVLHDTGFEKISGGFENSWRRDSGERQLHVVFYEGEKTDTGDSGYTYVYAHTEIKPSVAPLRHLSGSSKNGAVGVKRVKKLLDERGLGYEPIRP